MAEKLFKFHLDQLKTIDIVYDNGKFYFGKRYLCNLIGLVLGVIGLLYSLLSNLHDVILATESYSYFLSAFIIACKLAYMYARKDEYGMLIKNLRDLSKSGQYFICFFKHKNITEKKIFKADIAKFI